MEKNFGAHEEKGALALGRAFSDEQRLLALITHQRALIRAAATASNIDIECVTAAVSQLERLSTQAEDYALARKACLTISKLRSLRTGFDGGLSEAVRCILGELDAPSS